LPLIGPNVQERLYAATAKKAREMDCEPIEIGGIEDHLHIVLRFPPTVTIAGLAKELKGTPSHLMTYEIRPEEFFKWQRGYGAFTISKRDVNRVRQYIRNQARHHKDGDLWEDLERIHDDAPGE
jgi:REP element-mobilizing transposase RayT